MLGGGGANVVTQCWGVGGANVVTQCWGVGGANVVTQCWGGGGCKWRDTVLGGGGGANVVTQCWGWMDGEGGPKCRETAVREREEKEDRTLEL